MTLSLKEASPENYWTHSAFKGSLRTIYRYLPFKKSIIFLLRDTFGINKLPYNYLRYLAFKGPFNVKTENTGFQMINGYGFEIEASLFWKGANSFETQTLKVWKKLAQHAKHIFDVGANTGVYSLFAKDANPQAQVYAFEPIGRVFSYLELNKQINRRTKVDFDLNCFRMALSDYTGEGVMYDLPVEHMYTASLNSDIHQARGQPLQSVTETVKVMRIDDFLRDNAIDRLDLVKIDVESHEPAVIRGIGAYLAACHPSMIVEIWNNDVGKEVEQALEGCTYYYFAIEENGPKRVSNIRNDHPESGYLNYLICTRETAQHLNLL